MCSLVQISASPENTVLLTVLKRKHFGLFFFTYITRFRLHPALCGNKIDYSLFFYAFLDCLDIKKSSQCA